MVSTLASVCAAHRAPYTLGKTWTTDGLFRETRAHVARRRDEGCLVVECEVAALIAVGRFRRVDVGALLYAADNVSGEQWEGRGWKQASEARQALFDLAAEAAIALAWRLAEWLLGLVAGPRLHLGDRLVGFLTVSEDSRWRGGTIVADAEEVEVEVVVAHNERATLRVGDVFLKIDADQTHTDVEVEAMAMAPIPTPKVLWRKPPVLALAALSGTALGCLGEPSTASAAAWAAAGAAVRMLHDAPLPPWPGQSLDEIASQLDGECEWLVTNGVLPTDLVTRNRRIADAALRPWTPVFTHGDLQVDHVFVAGDEITGVIDWSEASQGDALYDLATLTLGHEEHLGDVVAGYGTDVDRDLIHAWWSLRCLLNVRWLIEHGFDPSSPGCEFAVLRSQR